MATVTTNNQYYTDIANAIRGKNGTETQYKPSEMAAAIQAISGGGEPEPPDDGKTRLYITIPANAMPDRPPPRNQVPLYIQQTVANGVTIDWGDGTAPETLPGTGKVNTTHTYEQGGDYVISLDPAEGCELGLGGANPVLGNMNDIYSIIYIIMLHKVTIGRNLTKIGDYAFTRSSLTSIIIPDSVKNIGVFAFDLCENLFYVKIPNSITNIKMSTFDTCSIVSIIIPSSVRYIQDGAFNYCTSMKEYHFFSETPPTLGSTNVFDGIPSDCIIYVPKGSAEAYKTATNWTTYAQYIQEEAT